MSPRARAAAAPDPTAAPVLAQIESAMARIRRRQTRRVLSRQAVRDGVGLDLQQLAVVDAVEEGTSGDGGEITVGMIAERLNIDPSRASRIVSEAIQAGLLRRKASQQDGRRICIELTARGQHVADQAHRGRRAYYDRLMDGWSERDRTEFAKLLERFTLAFERVELEQD